ncbi:MAG: response regulator [Phycisphaerales bacterium]|nr:response regulator [Phycisphaerales bacterium]
MGRILVIDDEPALRRILSLMVAIDGHDAIEAETVEEAQAALERWHFDLVLTDHRLRDGTGLEVVAAAHSADPTLPVVLVTAYASRGTAAAGRQAGAFDVVAKPFELRTIQAVIARAVRSTAGC